MTKQARIKMYQTHLKGEGLMPEVTHEGEIFFEFEGNPYFIMLEENDETFFRMVFPNFWPIKSEIERDQVIEAALYASMLSKAVKIFPVYDNTWAEIQLFCSPPKAFKPVFKRALFSLKYGALLFCEKMDELSDENTEEVDIN